MKLPASTPIDALSSHATAIPANVADQAVHWLIELQATPSSPRLLANWRRWRAQHPDHERAWQRIESVNTSLRNLSTPVQAALAHATLTPTRSGSRRQAVKTLAALFFTGGAVWLIREEPVWRRWAADHHTRVGERRTLMLADGSELVLNTDSAITLAFSDTQRRVRLIAGEVLISTAKDPHAHARPFIVETAQGEAQALGTRYGVRQLRGATQVSVHEAVVEIRPHRGAGLRRRLQAGERAWFSDTRVESTASTDESDTAWASGMIVARGMRLQDFLGDLSRYSTLSITWDPGVAGLQVSGSYPLADIAQVLEAVCAVLSLQTTRVTRLWGADAIHISDRRQRGGTGA